VIVTLAAMDRRRCRLLSKICSASIAKHFIAFEEARFTPASGTRNAVCEAVNVTATDGAFLRINY